MEYKNENITRSMREVLEAFCSVHTENESKKEKGVKEIGDIYRAKLANKVRLVIYDGPQSSREIHPRRVVIKKKVRFEEEGESGLFVLASDLVLRHRKTAYAFDLRFRLETEDGEVLMDDDARNHCSFGRLILREGEETVVHNATMRLRDEWLK